MSEKSFASGYALLVGVNENHVGAWALPDVAKDVTGLATVLLDSQRCGYPPENVKRICGKDATRQGILEGLEWLQQSVEGDRSGNSTAIIYYTGHGYKDDTTQPPEYYLIPYDVREDKERPPLARSRALRGLDFAQAVSAINPRRLLVIFDCCHAGGIDVKALGANGAAALGSPFPIDLLMAGEKALSADGGAEDLSALSQGFGRAVLSSSRADQKSLIRRDGKMSLFTYHVIEALTGHAQPEEGATEVLVSDVMGHVWRRVRQSAMEQWSKVQEPDYRVGGNFPVALLLGGRGLSKGELAPDPLAKSSVDDEKPDTTGDVITVENVAGDGIAIGRGAHANVRKGA